MTDNIFSQGFDNYEQELQQANQRNDSGSNNVYPFSLKVSETKEFIILDDTGFRFHEFSFYNPAVRKTANFTCRGDNDFLHNANKKPGLITVMTVLDMSGYIDSNGQRKGVRALKPLKLKKNAATRINMLRQDVARRKAEEMWNHQKAICDQNGFKSVDDVTEAILKKGGVLKNCKIRASRIGDKSESSGDDFQFITWVKSDFFKPEEKPFDYEVLFAPKGDQEIIAELNQLYGNQPPADIANAIAIASGQGGQQSAPQNMQTQQTQTHNTQQSSPQMDTQYSEAPSYSAEDIPF